MNNLKEINPKESFLLTFYFFRRLLHVRVPQLYPDPDASEEGQADVLLGALPLLRHPQDVLPRHQVQQEQHGPAGQVVLKL